MTIFLLAMLQCVFFSMVSRARNRDSDSYHMACSIASHTVWFLTMRHLVVHELSGWMLLLYVSGATVGSLAGSRISMVFEKWVGAKSDRGRNGDE